MAQQHDNSDGLGNDSETSRQIRDEHSEQPRNGKSEGRSPSDGGSVTEPHVRAAAPFVWQFERRLLLLDEEPPQWVLAELAFDVNACRYVEIRRASYDWPREAVGALLSRAFASGSEAASAAAEAMDDWFTRYYGLQVMPRAAASPDQDRQDRPR
jgi:hypothetical protein